MCSLLLYHWFCHAERKRSISSLCFVMLSNAKHLEVCTTIHRLRDLEILHFVQNDIVSVQNEQSIVPTLSTLLLIANYSLLIS